MPSLSRLDVGFATRRMTCVLDGELALSRQGLLLATRLAEEADVWLFRALWQALDNSDLFCGAPEGAFQTPGAARDAFPSEGSLEQWESARLEADLTELQFFFVGDARHESLLPKEVGKDLVKRFEVFSEELEALHRPVDEDDIPYDPIHECRRDATALAAALMRHRPVVLSRCPTNGAGRKDRSEPGLCGYLSRCGIDCRRVLARDALAVRSQFAPIFARAGLAEVIWDMQRDGQDLASIHLVAPNALAGLEREGGGAFGEMRGGGAVRNRGGPFWFRDAKAYWWTYA